MRETQRVGSVERAERRAHGHALSTKSYLLSIFRLEAPYSWRWAYSTSMAVRVARAFASCAAGREASESHARMAGVL